MRASVPSSFPKETTSWSRRTKKQGPYLDFDGDPQLDLLSCAHQGSLELGPTQLPTRTEPQEGAFPGLALAPPSHPRLSDCSDRKGAPCRGTMGDSLDFLSYHNSESQAHSPPATLILR